MTKWFISVDLEPMLDSIAAKLAHMDSDDQAKFFNLFIKELIYICDTRVGVETQTAFIKRECSKAFINFCKMIAYEEEP